jgi:hypothetical protein
MVGWPTVKAIVGNKVVPGLADWHLARTGYESQQTDEPVEPGRRDNLWAPVPGDHGAHGTFDAQATSWSVQLWVTMHRGALALGALGAAALGVVGAMGARGRPGKPAAAAARAAAPSGLAPRRRAAGHRPRRAA